MQEMVEIKSTDEEDDILNNYNNIHQLGGEYTFRVCKSKICKIM